MPDAPSSLIALRLAAPPADLVALLAGARHAGGIDRSSPVGDGRAQEVHWGGRIQRAAVRVVEDEDGAHLLRTETLIAGDGFVAGLARQAGLLVALAGALPQAEALGVRDLSARTERDGDWLGRVAGGGATAEDALATVVVPADGRAPGWIRTHGAARFGVPDLELYGVPDGAEGSAVSAVAAVAAALLAGGIAARLTLPDGTPVRLVPVLEAWPRLPMAWPGVGRAGATRGPGLDGPRATLSILHPARLGRHRLDLAGVTARLTRG